MIVDSEANGYGGGRFLQPLRPPQILELADRMDKVIFLIVGGSLGTLSRYGLGIVIARSWGTSFPWGTLVINLAGCFLIGLAFGLGERSLLGPTGRLAFTTGFLGAFTTF